MEVSCGGIPKKRVRIRGRYILKLNQTGLGAEVDLTYFRRFPGGKKWCVAKEESSSQLEAGGGDLSGRKENKEIIWVCKKVG